ncbi:MAG: aminopeptidase [Lachnospiraceae bacterium]|nr:aminopeptidase [Lachnospiraceae bacterium]
MNRMAYLKENIEVSERYELAYERIRQMVHETSVEEPYRGFFVREAEFLLSVMNLYEQVQYGDYDQFSLKELEDKNEVIYGELRHDYNHSWLNPEYAVELLGGEYGRYLCYLAASLRKCITAAMLQRMNELVIYAELFIEIYNIFEAGENIGELMKEAVYWFEHDYSEVFLNYSIQEMLEEEYSVYRHIVMEADLQDERYLYQYGLNITENEKRMAALLQSFSQEKIDAMARTYTEGYRKGFELAKKDLSKKGTVEVRYAVGMERMVRAAVKQFELMGLHTVIRTNGVTSTPANRQYIYDHRNDQGLYLDKAIVNRKLEVVRNAFEDRKEKAALMAGPAVIETFGEKPFVPENKKEAVTLTEKQQKLNVRYNTEYVQIYYQYIKGEERSFTIIAYPVAEIGEHYEEIFNETVKINNLDQTIYGPVQEKIIAALDQAEYVLVKGQQGNETDIRVKLHALEHPERETNFENCLADVNIPLGEVFTSPVLTGTEGVLNVSEVYLNGLKYKNLKLYFKDGQTETYTCDNFETEEENQKYIKENLLHFHEKLPIGEFAIGTNTTAYVMANKYDIVYKMPILIVEKMGPHFAVGDTCYSYEEDEKTYNPDGKEIVAKDNEITISRKEDPSKAYFGCHTDITIPYDEIGEITAVRRDGQTIPIIQNGRFVLAGTEALNEAFTEK